MDLAKLDSTAQSLELAKKEVNFLRNNTDSFDTYAVRADMISNSGRHNNHP